MQMLIKLKKESTGGVSENYSQPVKKETDRQQVDEGKNI